MGATVAIALFALIPSMQAHGALALMAGFFAVYLLEKLVIIHACQEPEFESHTLGWPALIGVGAESLIDGMAIAVGYRTAPALGLLIALAVFVHEVPRGLTTTVIMRQAGHSRSRTWLALLVDAGFAPLGVLLSSAFPAPALTSLTGFAAGVFLYVGACDLLPEAHRRFNLGVVAATIAGGSLIVNVSPFLG